MRRAAARYSCSGRLADDRPMSRHSDSSLILTSQFRVRSIILLLLLIQMANMSNLSLCQYYRRAYHLNAFRGVYLALMWSRRIVLQVLEG